MAVEDRYKHLLEAEDGRSADDPIVAWCNELDANAWYAQATKVFGLQRSAWNALMRIENRNESWTYTDAIRDEATAYEKHFDELPAPSIWMAFGMGECSEAVAAYIANIREGIGVLDKLDSALVTYKIGAVGRPGANSTGSKSSATGADEKDEKDEGLGTWGVVAILGGAAVVGITVGAFWSRKQQRSIDSEVA